MDDSQDWVFSTWDDNKMGWVAVLASGRGGALAWPPPSPPGTRRWRSH